MISPSACQTPRERLNETTRGRHGDARDGHGAVRRGTQGYRNRRSARVVAGRNGHLPKLLIRRLWVRVPPPEPPIYAGQRRFRVVTRTPTIPSGTPRGRGRMSWGTRETRNHRSDRGSLSCPLHIEPRQEVCAGQNLHERRLVCATHARSAC